MLVWFFFVELRRLTEPFAGINTNASALLKLSSTVFSLFGIIVLIVRELTQFHLLVAGFTIKYLQVPFGIIEAQ